MKTRASRTPRCCGHELSATVGILGGVSETTSSRLLTLLSLLQGRRDWPGLELADRLEVSPRTIRRDVERLRSLGYPVESMTGPAGGYQLRAGTAMPPLLLDDDEAIAIAVALRTAAGSSVAGVEETAVRALVKLEQVLPAQLRRRVQALQRATQTLQVYGSGPTVDPQCLTTLAAAVRDHERVRFDYTARDKAPQQARGRAALARQRRPPLVPGGLGLRTHGLAHVPRGPDRAGRANGRALRAPHAARPRRRGVRPAGPEELPRPLRGPDHHPRARGVARQALLARRRHRAGRAHAARCGRATTTSTGWRCGSR